MATNLVFLEGRQLDLTIASASSGDPVLIGTMTGVAVTDRDSTTGKATIDFGGVYDLSVKGVDDDGNSAVALGDKIYFVSGDTPVLSKKASGYFFGYALEAVSSGATSAIQVKNIDAGAPGAADLIAEEIPLTKLADLARGSIITGQTAGNRPTALSAKTSGQILVGDGTDLVSVAVSGDATLSSAGAVTIANGAVTKVKAKVFVSTEQTGNGSPQNVAHGLGATPNLVLVVPTEAPDSAWDIAEGSHDATNVVVTATNTLKYKVLAWV